MFDLATAEPEVCPYLGLPDDPRTRFAFADQAHRCHVGTKPSAIDLGHQALYCLTTDYPICKRFRSPKAARRQGSGPASTLGSSQGPVVGLTAPTALTATTALTARGSRIGEGNGRKRGRALGRIGLLAAILAVGAVVGAIRVGIIGGSSADDGEPGAVVSPAGAAPSAGATPSVPTPATSASTATPTPAPVATATRRSAPTIHVVVRDENLISIAAFYGVTVEAIQDANNIPDPSLIRAGDRLVIPPPP